MHIISRKAIKEFIEIHPKSKSKSKSSLDSWYKIVKNNDFAGFNNLREVFPSVDKVKDLYVFNISGNYFRLIAAIHFNKLRLYIRHILTHAEYDKRTWKNEH